jgi:crossover junction endodeoxyribonuclease RuvC
MRIIGIDPGTISCGYGIVELNNSSSSFPVYVASGEIRMHKGDALPNRLKVLFDSLKAAIEEYKPAHLCMEKIFYHKSIRSSFTLGSTRGIAMLLAAEHSIPVFEYNSTELKKALTGYGRAEKRQVKEMVKRILNLDSSFLRMSEDTADALALCICHANSTYLGAKIKVQEAKPKKKGRIE